VAHHHEGKSTDFADLRRLRPDLIRVHPRSSAAYFLRRLHERELNTKNEKSTDFADLLDLIRVIRGLFSEETTPAVADHHE
jgi:hypothetical protein